MSFKCGPDYIDPMFHRRVIGVPARNLDGFFMDRETLIYLLEKNSRQADIAVMEGVMGYYDGVGMEDAASSHELARDTKTPAVLIVPCKGMSRSVQAVLDGYLHFAGRGRSGIRGVIFNGLPPALYPAMQAYCEKQGVRALGHFPIVKEAAWESRHLGLVTADEIRDIKRQMMVLADAAESYLDLDGIWELAGEAETLPAPDDRLFAPEPARAGGKPVRIAAAADAAFCFAYEDNFSLLRALGCEIVPFSPLEDTGLPPDICGLILGGGYPELYAEELERNEAMRAAIKTAVEGGLPTHAECGGFLYLHRELRTADGRRYEMAGVLDGTCAFTDQLQHFGYVTLTAKEDTVLCRTGGAIRAHEFHRFVSDVPAGAFDTEKGGRHWGSYVSRYQMAAGFPHLHYYANPSFARHFVERCVAYVYDNGDSARRNA